MLDQKDHWTVALVIFVSLIAVQIGVHNLEWGLKQLHKPAVKQVNLPLRL